MPSRSSSPPSTAARRERRRSSRADPRGSRLTSPTLEVRLVDHSEEGLSVESNASLRIGARYRFTLEGPNGAESFVGTVLWCRLEATRPGQRGDVLPVYRAGIERG